MKVNSHLLCHGLLVRSKKQVLLPLREADNTKWTPAHRVLGATLQSVQLMADIGIDWGFPHGLVSLWFLRCCRECTHVHTHTHRVTPSHTHTLTCPSYAWQSILQKHFVHGTKLWTFNPKGNDLYPHYFLVSKEVGEGSRGEGWKAKTFNYVPLKTEKQKVIAFIKELGRPQNSPKHTQQMAPDRILSRRQPCSPLKSSLAGLANNIYWGSLELDNPFALSVVINTGTGECGCVL